MLNQIRAIHGSVVLAATPDGAPASGEMAFQSGGNLFQKEGCPYAISQSQAEEALANLKIRGNSISLLEHAVGERKNNH